MGGGFENTEPEIETDLEKMKRKETELREDAMLTKRHSGLLLHVVSLPSKFGIGDFGPAAHEFVDFLNEAGFSLWQILPLNPTDGATGNAPYSSISAFAGNPLLISIETLFSEGYLDRSDLDGALHFPKDRVDYDRVIAHRSKVFKKAHGFFRASETARRERELYGKFVEEKSCWLDDFALFVAIKQKMGGKPWIKWPKGLRDREPEALREAVDELADSMEYTRFLQYLFFKQLSVLRKKCTEKKVSILGDLPIYVSHDSVDVWTNREIFKLHPDGRKKVQAGVPPDYFSKTGQLWGNPVYRWDELAKSGYEWWLTRLEQSFDLYDSVRIDHFRGFAGYWEVPANHKNAIKGRWVDGPREDFFQAVRGRFGNLSILAEDLGTITDDVRELMGKFSIPGTKVLLFSFGGDFSENAYAPHNHIQNSVVYTGTHDNNTVRGWLEEEAGNEQKSQLFGYIGRRHDINDAPWELVRLAFQSVAKLCILPVQDVLGLGSYARMNRPATTHGNWSWRLTPGQLSGALARDLRELNHLTDRLPEQDIS